MRGALFASLVFFASPAMAFDCVPHVPDTDVIFKGEVASIDPSGKPAHDESGSKRLPDKLVTYKVIESYKGETGKVLYYSQSPSYSLPTAVGEIRWVYANWDVDKKELIDSSCGAVRHPDDLLK